MTLHNKSEESHGFAFNPIKIDKIKPIKGIKWTFKNIDVYKYYTCVYYMTMYVRYM